MNSIVTLNDTGCPVTTSLAIADGVGNPHSSVIKLIRQNTSDLEEFGLLDFKSESTGGRPTEYAMLNEQQSTLLLTYMRNNDVVREFKKRLVKAFFELAQQRQAPAVENLSRLEILQLAMQSEEERLRLEQEKRLLEHQLEEEAPLVAFAKQVEIAQDAISVAQAAKILGTGQRRLFAFLRQIGWVSRRNEPYQTKIEAGYLDVKLGSWEHPNHGLQQSVTALVTGKGLAKLQKLWSQHHKEHAA
ncbi:phage regulatory protein/antirepressor Ant [Salmonella enterica subsp. enterica serovar Ohio]|nr:phage regulatory protein/antirepressor Ant [Salmonella enterica]EBF3951673.1 phage regulatory protein/antirepressor Ant [Salmonella enterica subsp. enterica serovar Ohio]ECJ2057560.1 phage regulatory protein/antirepressor Ant [Salmonella enterica subsp. enterica serovar Ohio]ECS2745518.1 phage regulatory protein/antirepressor Ant [Salmonella enterica subsp. enterica serovar Ohio]EKK1038885.1 phage regulatory protein/antirepressor Ant [Salmonella enterica subsp. enterica serovar Senftenberg]